MLLAREAIEGTGKRKWPVIQFSLRPTVTFLAPSKSFLSSGSVSFAGKRWSLSVMLSSHRGHRGLGDPSPRAESQLWGGTVGGR